MRRTLFSLIIASITLLQGCAVAPTDRALKPEYAANVTDAQVYLLMPQKLIFAVTTDFTVGSEFGLIGQAINEHETSKNFQNMMKNVSPIIKSTSDVRWRPDLARALQQSNVFSNPKAVKFVNSGNADEAQVASLVNSSKKPLVLVIKAEYYLDSRYRVLTIGANTSLYKKGNTVPLHSFRSVYYSKPIATEMEVPITGKFAVNWASNHGAMIRKYEREGVTQIASLIKTALIDRPSNVPGNNDTLQTYFDWDSGLDKPRQAKLISTSIKSSILLDERGRFLSVPKLDTYASLNEAKHPVKNGKARIYVFQKDGIVGVPPELYDNGKSVGTIYPNSYFSIDVVPGSHTYTLKYNGNILGASIPRAQFAKVKPVTLNIHSGMRYSLFFKGYAGFFTASDALQEIPLAKAASMLTDLPRAY